jgi:hypothetical protein
MTFATSSRFAPRSVATLGLVLSLTGWLNPLSWGVASPRLPPWLVLLFPTLGILLFLSLPRLMDVRVIHDGLPRLIAAKGHVVFPKLTTVEATPRSRSRHR